MFIYNITFKIDWQLHDNWLRWMQEEHISSIMKTGCFTRYQLVRLLEIDEEEGPAYALQLYADSKADYNRYVELYLRGIERESGAKWKDGQLSFSTLMEIVR